MKKTAMDAQRSNVLKEWSVGMYQLLEWGQCVGHVQKGTQEEKISATVYPIKQ